MYELKKNIGKVFTSKFVGTGPSSYKKRMYRAAVSQRLRNTVLKHPVRSKCSFKILGSDYSLMHHDILTGMKSSATPVPKRQSSRTQSLQKLQQYILCGVEVINLELLWLSSGCSRDYI